MGNYHTFPKNNIWLNEFYPKPYVILPNELLSYCGNICITFGYGILILDTVEFWNYQNWYVIFIPLTLFTWNFISEYN